MEDFMMPTTPTNHQIDAIFFDIDGTLLSFRTQEVPANTLKALRKLHQNGIRLFLCTGRPPRHVEMLKDKLDIPFDGAVLLNGQYCTDQNGQCFYHNPHTQENLQQITAWLKKHPDIRSSFMERDYIYTNIPMEPDVPYYQPCEPMERCLSHTTYQVSPSISPETEQLLLSQIPGIKSARWSDEGTDLIPLDGGKAVGMQKLLEHFQLNRENCMSFGDGLNDLEMLRYSHIGIAMGNGNDLLKQHADYVTDDIDEDGLYHALQHFKLVP